MNEYTQKFTLTNQITSKKTKPNSAHIYAASIHERLLLSEYALRIWYVIFHKWIRLFFDLWRLHRASASTIVWSTNASTQSCLLLSATFPSFWQCQNQSWPFDKTPNFYDGATWNLHAVVATIGSGIQWLFIDVLQRYHWVHVWGLRENWLRLRLSQPSNTFGIHSRSTNPPAVWQLLQLFVWIRNCHLPLQSRCRHCGGILWYCGIARHRRNKALQPIRHSWLRYGNQPQMSVLWFWEFKFNLNLKLYSSVRNL